MRGTKAKKIRAIARARKWSEPAWDRSVSYLKHADGTYRRIYQDLKKGR